MARNSDSAGKYRRTYLKEWRAHRGLTQAQVVAQLEFLGGDLPTTAASLSRLENGHQPYSQPILEALAQIYDTEAGYLITRHPGKAGEVVDLMARLSDQEQRELTAIAQALIETRNSSA